MIEHLAEPIGFLAEIHRVLRPGGAALLVLPDRRRTFDAAREATPLAHLVADHATGVTEVDDEHIIGFLTKAGSGAQYLGLPEDPDARQRWFAWHRERSVHVHCWSEDEFPDVIAYTIRALGQTWTLVDALATDAEGPTGDEFGYVLNRSPDGARAAERADRFVAEWKAWRESRRPVFTRRPVVIPSRARLVVDAPQAGATATQPFLVCGWAIDDVSLTGSGIDLIEVWALENGGREFPVGVTPPGHLRPDAARHVFVAAQIVPIEIGEPLVGNR